jgi:superkiller protein 3
LSSYDKALAINPDQVEALNSRGDTLQQLRRFGAALSSYDKALAIKPDHVEALNNRGLVCYELDHGGSHCKL